MIDHFTFFRSYYESLKELPPQEFKDVLLSVCAYVFDDEEPSITGIAKTVFLLIKPHLDKSKEIGEKRSIAGKAGAEKKKAMHEEAKAKQEEGKPKQAASKPKQTQAKISEVPELDDAIRQFIEHRKKLNVIAEVLLFFDRDRLYLGSRLYRVRIAGNDLSERSGSDLRIFPA